jgi:hypothetical protein
LEKREQPAGPQSRRSSARDPFQFTTRFPVQHLARVDALPSRASGSPAESSRSRNPAGWLAPPDFDPIPRVGDHWWADNHARRPMARNLPFPSAVHCRQAQPDLL